MQRIAEVQDEEKKLVKIKANIEVRKDFKIFKDGALTYHGRLCVPSIKELKEEILKEAHGTKYTTHLGSTKMYKAQTSVLVDQNEERYCKSCRACDVKR